MRGASSGEGVATLLALRADTVGGAPSGEGVAGVCVYGGAWLPCWL